MSDFIDLIRETFAGTPGLPDEQSLDDRVAALDRRMKTVGSMTWIGVTIMFAIAIVTIGLLIAADADTETKWLILYGSLFVWAIVAIAMIKLWHFQMQSDTAAMKEILRIQAMLQASDQS